MAQVNLKGLVGRPSVEEILRKLLDQIIKG